MTASKPRGFLRVSSSTGTIELRRNLYSGGAPVIAEESRIVGLDKSHNGTRQVVAPYTDYDADLGSATKRFRRAYLQNVSIFPPASVTPATNGEVTFELNSNTVLNVKVRGSDGVVRSAVISLA